MTSSSNSERWAFEWVVWSEAWSSVAVSEAWAEDCFRRLRTREEAGRAGLWKRVITSRVLCWWWLVGG